MVLRITINVQLTIYFSKRNDNSSGFRMVPHEIEVFKGNMRGCVKRLPFA